MDMCRDLAFNDGIATYPDSAGNLVVTIDEHKLNNVVSNFERLDER